MQVSRSTLSRAFHATAQVDARIGFVGLGNMGAFMASNLIKAGHSLVVFDLARAPLEELRGRGAAIAKSPTESARDVDAFITMLPSSPHVREVYESGVLDVARPGTMFIDCSTIDPVVSRALNAAAVAKRMRVCDAPVSGGVGGAEAATLTFMVGGSAADFEAAKPLLACMGKNIVHCGGPGTGQIAKLCNNLILGISMLAVSEAMNLGVKLGADPRTLAAIINTSSGRCWSSDTYNPVSGVQPNVPSSRGYTGGFGAALMAKDLGLALDAAKFVGAPMPSLATTFQVYQMMLQAGLAKKDFSVVYPFLQGQAASLASK